MTPTPELLALRDVCLRLDGLGITYMLTGSLAASYYARPRMTRDIDLVVALGAVDTQQLVDALGADYHADADAIASAIRDERPWNIIHLPSVVKIDLIPRKDTPYRRVEFERRQRVDLAGIPMDRKRRGPDPVQARMVAGVPLGAATPRCRLATRSAARPRLSGCMGRTPGLGWIALGDRE